MSLKTYGTVLQYGDTADYATAATWTLIARTNSIKPPKSTAKDIDTTVLDSADEFEETIPGLASGGELKAQCEYDKTKTTTIHGFFRTIKAYRIKYSDNSGWKFNGYISDYGDDEIENGDIIRTTLKIKVTGKPVPDTDVLT